MKTTVSTWHLDTIQENLQDALKVVLDAKTQNEHGYPYCFGYLQASVSNAIYEINRLKSVDK
jgi:hypothetical protein